MTMHYVAAIVGILALLLHGARSGDLLVLPMSRPARTWVAITRLGMSAVFLTVISGFLELAMSDQPFLERHLAVLGALTCFVIGHIGMIVTKAPSS